MTATALITGVGGQDGVHLARRLLAAGQRVVGTVQPGIPVGLLPYLDGVEIVEHDLTDTDGFAGLVDRHDPATIYNLASFTSVHASWSNQDEVFAVNSDAVVRMLDVLAGSSRRFFHASSSEIFGPGAANPQTESTPLNPGNPYGESKARAHEAVAAARAAGLFASTGILYSHESPLRGEQFVTRKITKAAVEIAAGKRDVLTLGNLDVSRDWGAASDFVEAMQLVTDHDKPGDFIIATGTSHSLRSFVELVFELAGINDAWSHIEQDEALLRPVDQPGLVGDPSHARATLGWEASTSFEALVHLMVSADQRRLASGVDESADYLSDV
ncbi:GDPmannose 4,6-dehydratase [Aeromicrobium panaciterrae]|uniref:GDP-mannose 4,6-dehydratase n=1 Tax=Aeromicrobium panaciterrae TaxID=363861 RepID=A0ABU1UKM8_9ACTN|nr:GDP-mannose 4,6-dehydratase [Aeromicrobium panaciterrae]MDR7085710.1 GDPmannose 4,6-dehydratase [Aeromicrobium panaciterrae]